MFKRICTILLLLLVGIGLFTAIFSASATPTTEIESTIVEYPIPTTSGGPQSIAVQAPGHIWFTLPEENAIGELVITSTIDYKFQIYTVPTSNSEPYDLIYDGRYIWFTERAGNQLGQLDTITKIITETILTPDNSMPTSIDVAPNGNLWITKPGTSFANISRYDPNESLDPFEDYTYTNSSNPEAVPQDITVVNDGRIGFTVPDMNLVVELSFNPTKFSEIFVNAVGIPSFSPGGITDDGQSLWVSAPSKSWIGRFGAGTLGNFLWLSLLSDEAKPTAIHNHLDSGNRQLWYVGTSSNHIGNVVVDADGKKVSMIDLKLTQANSQPTDIAVDANLHAWIAESGSNKIAEWRPPYVIPVYLPLITN